MLQPVLLQMQQASRMLQKGSMAGSHMQLLQQRVQDVEVQGGRRPRKYENHWNKQQVYKGLQHIFSLYIVEQACKADHILEKIIETTGNDSGS